MDNACVIGYGVVGKATAEVFGITKIVDRSSSEANIDLKKAAKCKFVFICLPTPVKGNGEYFTDDIFETIRQINQFGGHPIFVIRSTVYPGFASYLQAELNINTVLSNPEFLSEDTALEDTKNPPFVVIGGIEQSVRDELKAYYEARIKGAPVILTDNNTAEMIKITMNAYFATKVIFANQAYDACKKLGVNYETLKKVLEAHPYGPKNHFAVWYKKKRGVHGSCLPKDSKAFSHYAVSDLVEKVIQLNENYIHLKHD